MNIIAKVLLGAMILLKQLFFMTSYLRASELWFYNYFYFLLNFIYRYILIRNKPVYTIVHKWKIMNIYIQQFEQLTLSNQK